MKKPKPKLSPTGPSVKEPTKPKESKADAATAQAFKRTEVKVLSVKVCQVQWPRVVS